MWEVETEVGLLWRVSLFSGPTLGIWEREANVNWYLVLLMFSIYNLIDESIIILLLNQRSLLYIKSQRIKIIKNNAKYLNLIFILDI